MGIHSSNDTIPHDVISGRGKGSSLFTSGLFGCDSLSLPNLLSESIRSSEYEFELWMERSVS